MDTGQNPTPGVVSPIRPLGIVHLDPGLHQAAGEGYCSGPRRVFDPGQVDPCIRIGNRLSPSLPSLIHSHGDRHLEVDPVRIIFCNSLRLLIVAEKRVLVSQGHSVDPLPVQSLSRLLGQSP